MVLVNRPSLRQNFLFLTTDRIDMIDNVTLKFHYLLQTSKNIRQSDLSILKYIVYWKIPPKIYFFIMWRFCFKNETEFINFWCFWSKQEFYVPPTVKDKIIRNLEIHSPAGKMAQIWHSGSDNYQSGKSSNFTRFIRTNRLVACFCWHCLLHYLQKLRKMNLLDLKMHTQAKKGNFPDNFLTWR